MGENFNTILTGKVRPILILQPHLGKIVFPSFVNVLLKQIKHSLSLSPFFISCSGAASFPRQQTMVFNTQVWA